ncbi:UDP-glycosyltransferase 73C6-like protein [Carex littledalei]|uniref:Glycosyltransferase n=1 Tax=Carex littledalei TaxID=544730 RepID=A0A833QSL4_9POAL|nr:UDP-glycosyltransferase 73C6-like protein [Carex littledalei]
MTSIQEETKPHFVLVPLAAQGHLIPMVDMAHVLAERGLRISLITTPANAARIKPIIDRVHELELPIQFVELAFPGAKFGLPEGCESMELIPRGFFRNFFDAVYFLCEPLELFLKSLQSAPNCMITDMSNAWTGPVARKLGIPRVIFHGPSCFYISAAHNLEVHKVYDHISNSLEFVRVPDFPVEVQVNKMQTPGFFNFPGFEDIRRMILEEESTSDGIVVNTFDELEKPFIEHYERVIAKRVWTIGPTCLCNKENNTKSIRGNKETVDRNEVLTWLDQKDVGSVLYSNFGSAAYSNPFQLIEIASGLEASKRPFILVIKKKEIVPEVEKWLSEGFEERVKDRGLLLTGWAPQMVILSHPAVGGFMTHCGWNSILEAVSMGVPMITWPHFTDQFLNEKLVVDVLKIGISIGVKMPDLGNDVVMVNRRDVETAALALMDGGNEGRERRDRARDLADKAKKAVEEQGSSWKNMADMISYFVGHGRNNEEKK